MCPGSFEPRIATWLRELRKTDSSADSFGIQWDFEPCVVSLRLLQSSCEIDTEVERLRELEIEKAKRDTVRRVAI